MTIGEKTRAGAQRGGGLYDVNYANFHSDLYAGVRRDAFGEDLGQNSWLTAREQDEFLPFLNLAAGRKLLDVACGAGGPALRLAARTGCSVAGVDLHPAAIAAATALAAARGLAGVADFRLADASVPLPFPDESIDAITCID